MDRIELVTLNFWGLHPPLDARLELAGEQLEALAPDVVCMQEVMPTGGEGGRTTADVLGERLGMQVRFEPAVERSGEVEGLAVLSKHGIAEHRVTRLPEPRPGDERILLSARIGQLWCHTTHLHWRLDDGFARERQVVAIDEVIRGIETEAPQLLCGDFNATPEHDEIRYMRGLTTLEGRRTHYQDAWDRCHPGESGLTWCAENEHTRHLRSLDVDRRIDYIFVTTRTKDGRGTVEDARVVLDGRGQGGICASDHYGVWARVRVSPGHSG